MRVLVLLLIAGAAVLSSCEDDSAPGVSVTLETLWPAEEGLTWVYAGTRSARSAGVPENWPTPEEVPPSNMSATDYFGDLWRDPEGAVSSAHAEFALSFVGSLQTTAGTNLPWLSQYGASLAVIDRTAECWERTDERIAQISTGSTEPPRRIFLEEPLESGHRFAWRPADESPMVRQSYAQIFRLGYFEVEEGRFRNCVAVLYVLERLEVMRVASNPAAGGTWFPYTSTTVVVYAPGRGPVYIRERERWGTFGPEEPAAAWADVELDLYYFGEPPVDVSE